jgi:hypothetical protein
MRVGPSAHLETAHGKRFCLPTRRSCVCWPQRERVALPEKNGAVRNLAHIQIDSPSDIVIRAEDGTTWTTSNGGASWK